MNMFWGGKQGNLRKTKIKELGPYHSILSVGDEQSMNFTEDDFGNFYLSTAEKTWRKYAITLDERKKRDRTKGEILFDLKAKGFQVKGYYCKTTLHSIAQTHDVPICVEENVVV